MHRNEFNSATREQTQITIVAWSNGNLVEWVDEGQAGPVGWQPITDEQAATLLAPTHAQLAAATLAKARALRPPIMSILDGMQASALTNATTILVDQQPVALSAVIEDCKQALKDLPTAVDLSAATTQQQMEYIVLLAYKAIVQAAPPEIKSAFDSLKP